MDAQLYSDLVVRGWASPQSLVQLHTPTLFSIRNNHLPLNSGHLFALLTGFRCWLSNYL